MNHTIRRAPGLGLSLTAAIALAACNGGESPENEADTADGEAAAAAGDAPDAFITGTASGAVETDFALNGVFKCQDDGIGEPDMTAEIIGTGGGQQIAITLPYDEGGVGSFELLGSDDARYTPGAMEIRYRGPERVTYRSGSGELTITEWPEAAGDTVTGSFTATLEEDGQTVTVAGDISGSTLREFACAG